MAKQELSIPKLMAEIPTEADAYLKLEELRWNGRTWLLVIFEMCAAKNGISAR